ncbi:MAG: GAF domain-containing protein [Rhizorhabdus sp.]|nr:GAF domain-containing protein [Rhizorhabdus sp.]
MSRTLEEDVAAIRSIDAVPSVLDLASARSGMAFAGICRVTPDRWMACAISDRIGLGISAGDELSLKTTICDEVRGHGRAIIIDDITNDPLYRAHPTPRLYGFRSYISAPIVVQDGGFFGTLFAVDPKPARLSNSNALLCFDLLAGLIALELSRRDWRD